MIQQGRRCERDCLLGSVSSRRPPYQLAAAVKIIDQYLGSALSLPQLITYKNEIPSSPYNLTSTSIT